MKTSNKGINYAGFTGANKNRETGIRFGVIHSGDVGQAWYDSSEPDYGDPTCPKCGNEAIEYSTAEKTLNDNLDEWTHEKYECNDYACLSCKHVFGSESAYGDTPNAFILDDGEYKAEQSGEDCDIFILKSPYFTYAQFCSPCAPGACYLVNELEEKDPENRAYCFGHDWFEGKKAPYTVYSVETGEIVQPE